MARIAELDAGGSLGTGGLVDRLLASQLAGGAIGWQRVQPSRVANPAYALGSGVPSRRRTHVELIDAGIDVNAPLPSLLVAERAIDVIVVLDASRDFRFDDDDSSVLRRAEAWAQAPGRSDWARPMPSIDYAGIGARPVAVCPGQPGVSPTIVFVPLERLEGGPDLDPREVILRGPGSWLHFGNFGYKTEESVRRGGGCSGGGRGGGGNGGGWLRRGLAAAAATVAASTARSRAGPVD